MKKVQFLLGFTKEKKGEKKRKKKRQSYELH
jgi:hypothetical protein